MSLSENAFALEQIYKKKKIEYNYVTIIEE